MSTYGKKNKLTIQWLIIKKKNKILHEFNKEISIKDSKFLLLNAASSSTKWY